MGIQELKQFESVYQPSKEIAFCWLRKQYVQLSTEENHAEIVNHANDSLCIWQAAKAQSEKALLEQFEINNKLVEQIEELKAKAQAIPDGFVLVTKEPNLEFKDRLRSYLDNLWMGEWGCDWDGFICVNGIDSDHVWKMVINTKAMIEAQEQSQ